jgi:signal transduction histidine kinase
VRQRLARLHGDLVLEPGPRGGTIARLTLPALAVDVPGERATA